MKHWAAFLLVCLMFDPTPSLAQSGNSNPVRVALIKMPYVGERNVAELSPADPITWNKEGFRSSSMSNTFKPKLSYTQS
jgi:hypothetical protein